MSNTTRWLDVGQMDELGRLDSPLHRLDSRAKAIVTVAFIVFVMSFDRYAISALMPFFIFPALTFAASRLPWKPLLRKLLIAAPFALLVGALNPLLDRQPMLQIGSWAISGGWVSFANIVLRFVLTVGAALILLAGTGMYRLCAGLERLGVPSVFVTQLLFLYRYLFVISDEGLRMLRSAHLRADPAALPLRVYGGLVGHLLMRSINRAGRIYQAMVARGYDGDMRRLYRQRFRWSDAAFVVGWLAFFVIARRWNLAEYLGRILNG